MPKLAARRFKLYWSSAQPVHPDGREWRSSKPPLVDAASLSGKHGVACGFVLASTASMA